MSGRGCYMNLLTEKIKEVARTLFPVVILVLILSFTVVDLGTTLILRFLVCSVLLLIGLAIFLVGVDLSIDPIGQHMSFEVATSKSRFMIAIMSFLLGFLITVAEPDLLILGQQVEQASGGMLNATLIVYIVSIGVGIMVSLAVFRLLKGIPYNIFMAITYTVIMLLSIFISEEFLAISFDASGATTGALTTPFILALSLGLSNAKGGEHAEENSFGIVGAMSTGPILAIMLMSIFTGQKNIEGTVAEFVVTDGIFKPIIDIIPHIFLESLVALLPISILFFIYNFKKFKLAKDDISKIIKGLIILLTGLALFLTAVNSGFMEVGRIIGTEIANFNHWALVAIGFLLGFIIVLVEPAVHVLGQQVEEVTSGHIPVKLIRMTLSIAVALAVSLSMVRIIIPEVKLSYFIIPGFILAVILSFVADPIFVGIAYDAGGVASGPMTATFILAFAQGAASMIETADVMVDGFGVIAMVAMAPVLSLMIVGTIFRHKKKLNLPDISDVDDVLPISDSPLDSDNEILHNFILVSVNRGFAEKVVDVARFSGATGATIARGRHCNHENSMLSFLQIELQPEKEFVMLITGAMISKTIINVLLSNQVLQGDGEIEVFVSPTEDALVKSYTSENDNRSSETDIE